MGANSKAERNRIRAKVLGEWRGSRVERNTAMFEHPVSDLLPGIMRKVGVQDQINAEAITEEWQAIVGDFLGSNSRPVKLQKRVLRIKPLFCVPIPTNPIATRFPSSPSFASEPAGMTSGAAPAIAALRRNLLPVP